MEQVLKPTRVMTPANKTMPRKGAGDYARSGMILDREPMCSPVKITILTNEKITIRHLG